MSGFDEGDKVRLKSEPWNEQPGDDIGTIIEVISHKEVYVKWDNDDFSWCSEDDDGTLIYKQSELELVEEEASDATK